MTFKNFVLYLVSLCGALKIAKFILMNLGS